MPVDRNSLKSLVEGAASGAPPKPAAPSMADVAKAAMGTAAVTAEAGKPASASAGPQPGQPAPAKPRTIQDRIEAIRQAAEDRFPLVWRSEEVELPVEEVQRLAQIGMSARNLEEQREALRRDRNGFEAFQAWQRWLHSNPDKAAHIQAVYEGRVDPRAAQAGRHQEDDLESAWGGTQDRGSNGSADPAVEARLARMEKMLEGQGMTLQQQRFEERLNDSVRRNRFASADKDREAYVRDRVALAMAAGTYDTVDEAVTVESNRLRRIVEGELENIRSQREQQADDLRAVPPSGGRFVLPKLPDEGIQSGPKGLRNSKDKIREWFAGAQRAIGSGPT